MSCSRLFLLGDGHHHRLDGDDLVDDVADFLARRFRIELGELGQIDGVDQGVEDGRFDLVIVVRAVLAGPGRGLGLLGGNIGACPAPRRPWPQARRRPWQPMRQHLWRPARRRRAAAHPRPSPRGRPAWRQPVQTRYACRTMIGYARFFPLKSDSEGRYSWRPRRGAAGDGTGEAAHASVTGGLGGDLDEHLAVVGGLAELGGIERQHRGRIDAHGLGEILGGDFGPPGHAHLVDDQAGMGIVGARALDDFNDILGVAQRGEVRRRHHHDIVGGEQAGLIQGVQPWGRSGSRKGWTGAPHRSPPRRLRAGIPVRVQRGGRREQRQKLAALDSRRSSSTSSSPLAPTAHRRRPGSLPR